jgi:GNAT superfamily N-acetyltransferase
VAERQGRAVGSIFGRVQGPIEDADVNFVREVGETRLVVDTLIVARTSWRRGIGSTLLAAAETWARERGATVAQLDTYIDSPVSVPFYEAGMRYRRRSLLLWKSLESHGG